MVGMNYVLLKLKKLENFLEIIILRNAIQEEIGMKKHPNGKNKRKGKRH